MQFRLRLLFILMMVVAVVARSFDQYLHETVVVEFSSPDLVTDLDPDMYYSESALDYVVSFTIHYDQYPIDGFACHKFGPHPLFGKVTSNNLSEIDGTKVKLRRRRRSFFWRQESRIEDKLADCFDDLLVFPNVQEWRQKATPR